MKLLDFFFNILEFYLFWDNLMFENSLQINIFGWLYDFMRRQQHLQWWSWQHFRSLSWRPGEGESKKQSQRCQGDEGQRCCTLLQQLPCLWRSPQIYIHLHTQSSLLLQETEPVPLEPSELVVESSAILNFTISTGTSPLVQDLEGSLTGTVSRLDGLGQVDMMMIINITIINIIITVIIINRPGVAGAVL